MIDLEKLGIPVKGRDAMHSQSGSVSEVYLPEREPTSPYAEYMDRLARGYDPANHLRFIERFWSIHGLPSEIKPQSIMEKAERISAANILGGLMIAPMLDAAGRTGMGMNVRLPEDHTMLGKLMRRTSDKPVEETLTYRNAMSQETDEVIHQNVLRYIDSQGRMLTPPEYAEWLLECGLALESPSGRVWIISFVNWSIDRSYNTESRSAEAVLKSLGPTVTPELIIAMQMMRIDRRLEQPRPRIDLSREVVVDIKSPEQPILKEVVGVSRNLDTDDLVLLSSRANLSTPMFAATITLSPDTS